MRGSAHAREPMTEPPKITTELLNWRLDWVKREAEKAARESSFQNGKRAGLEEAVLAITEGRSSIYHSIDPPPRKEKR